MGSYWGSDGKLVDGRYEVTGSYATISGTNPSVPAAAQYSLALVFPAGIKGNVWARCDKVFSVLVYFECDTLAVVGTILGSSVAANWPNGATKYSIDANLPSTRTVVNVTNNDATLAAQIQIGIMEAR